MKRWMVVSANADFNGGNAPYSVFSTERAALDYAQNQAERSSMAYDWHVYEVTMIGQMCRGRATFHPATPERR